jgi:CspA family cold shock protein
MVVSVGAIDELKIFRTSI